MLIIIIYLFQLRLTFWTAFKVYVRTEENYYWPELKVVIDTRTTEQMRLLYSPPPPYLQQTNKEKTIVLYS